MFKILFAIFIVVPLLELYVLIEVGSAIGALPTILLTILTAALGAFLMKHQGVQVVKQAQLSLSRGEMPQQQVVEGMLVFIGGAVLLLPGLVTDLIGFLLLIPPIRAALAKRWLSKRVKAGAGYQAYVHTEWTVRDAESGRISYTHTSYQKNDAPDVIEGEVLTDDRQPSVDNKKT